MATTFRERLTRLFGGGAQAGDRYVTPLGAAVFGCLLLVVGAVLLAAVFETWPTVDDFTRDASTHEETAALFFGLLDVSVDKSTGLLLVVMVMGALGAYIHAATSFATYAGNRTLKMSWMWWFWLRIPMGAALALGFYFVLRAGLVGVQEGSQDINSYGTAAIAFLSGLFSKQAIDKLEEIFETLVNVREGGDKNRRDKAGDRAPVITRLRPDRIEPHKAVELTIIGQRFRKGARVRLGDRLHTAAFKDEDRVVVEVAENLTDPGTLRVAVVNPAPHDEQSNVTSLRVDEN